MATFRHITRALVLAAALHIAGAAAHAAPMSPLTSANGAISLREREGGQVHDEAMPLPAPASERRSLGGGDEAAEAGATGGMGVGAGELVRVLGALAVVIGLLLGARHMIRRAGGSIAGGAGRPSGVIEVLARYPLGRGHALVLLRLGRRVLLVHQNGGAMTTLADVSDPDDVADLLARVESGARHRPAARFNAMLERFGTEHERHGGGETTPFRPAALGGDSVQIVDLTARRSPLRRFTRRGAA